MGGARQQGHRSSLQDEVSADILNFKLLQGSERLDVPWQSPATTDVIPAHAGIQYTTAIPLSHCGLWILGRPIKPSDDGRCTIAFAVLHRADQIAEAPRIFLRRSQHFRIEHRTIDQHLTLVSLNG
jgi:hypothetical protein